MCILIWMQSRTMTDQTPNGVFKRILGVEAIFKKIQKGRLFLYKHVWRRFTSAPIQGLKAYQSEVKKRRDKSCRTWTDQLSLNIDILMVM